MGPHVRSSNPDFGLPHCLDLYVTTNRWSVSFRGCHSFRSVFLHICTLWEVHLTLHCLLNSHTSTSWNRRQWFGPRKSQAKKERKGDLENFGASVLSSPVSSQRMENSYHSGALFSVRRVTKLLGIMKYFHYWVTEATQEEIISWREMTRDGGWERQHLVSCCLQKWSPQCALNL